MIGLGGASLWRVTRWARPREDAIAFKQLEEGGERRAVCEGPRQLMKLGIDQPCQIV